MPLTGTLCCQGQRPTDCWWRQMTARYPSSMSGGRIRYVVVPKNNWLCRFECWSLVWTERISICASRSPRNRPPRKLRPQKLFAVPKTTARLVSWSILWPVGTEIPDVGCYRTKSISVRSYLSAQSTETSDEKPSLSFEEASSKLLLKLKLLREPKQWPKL